MRFSFEGKIPGKIAAASLYAVLATLMPQVAVSADAASAALEGSWLVTVGSERRERFLVVRGARTAQGKIAVSSTSYSWLDGKDAPVKAWDCEVFGDELRLRFLTPADSQVTVAFRADETTASGTFLRKDGAVRELRMTRIPPEELAELRVAAKLAAKPQKAPARPHANADSKIYLVYVSAPDCPSCSGYEAEYFGRKDLMAKVVPDFPKITYVKSGLATYKQPGLNDPVSTVPAELAWLKGKGPDGKLLIKRRGVPFFALVVDQKIWAQGHGTTGLETLIAPEIKRAVAEKYASR